MISSSGLSNSGVPNVIMQIVDNMNDFKFDILVNDDTQENYFESEI